MSTTNTDTTATTTKKTHLVVNSSLKKTAESDSMKSQLEARAARFGLNSSGEPGKITVNQDKLAARAARFADITKTQSVAIGTAARVKASSNPAEADILAKRAARFADVSKDTPKTSSDSRKSKGKL